MKMNRGWRMAVEGLLAALIASAGLVQIAVAQSTTAPKTATAPKARAKKAPVRRAARLKAQTAPTRERIVAIQEALAREGFYTGTPSGKWDVPTTQAMKSFQTSKGLTPTGKLGALSLQKLGLGSETAGRGAPVPSADASPSVLSESELNEPEPAEPPAN